MTASRPQILYKYLSADGLIATLMKRAVRFCDPRLFNDPFDLQLDLRLGFSNEEFAEAYSKELMRVVAGDDITLDPSRVTYPFVANLRESFRSHPEAGAYLELAAKEAVRANASNSEKVLAEVNSAWHGWLGTTRLFCASEANDSLLMWAHYCDSHRGGVIGLRGIPELDTFLLSAEPVEYRDEMPVFMSLENWVRRATAQGGDRVFARYVLVKSTCWSYEKEWRTLWTQGPSGAPYRYSEMKPQELEGVYLGCRMSPDDRRRVAELIRQNYPECRLYEGQRSPTRFAVEFHEIPA